MSYHEEFDVSALWLELKMKIFANNDHLHYCCKCVYKEKMEC